MIQLQRLIISGSLAAFFITLVPFAIVAAIIMFSVAPTEAKGNLIFAPFKRPFTLAFIYPSFNLSFAPNFSNPNRWRSTGLAPIAHPPGKETLAFPSLAKSGPRTSIEARIFLTIS